MINGLVGMCWVAVWVFSGVMVSIGTEEKNAGYVYI